MGKSVFIGRRGTCWFWCVASFALGLAQAPAMPARALAGKSNPMARSPAGRLPNGLETFDAVWQIIQDTHFDPNFRGTNWDLARQELRPEAEAAATPPQLRRIITRMLARLGESHMALIPHESAGGLGPGETNVLAGTDESSPTQAGSDFLVDPAPARKVRARFTARGSERLLQLSTRRHRLKPSPAINRNSGANGDLGFEVRRWKKEFVVSRVDRGGPADEAGVKPGWIVKAIGASTVADLVGPFDRGITKALAEVVSWSTVTAALHGRPGDTLHLRLVNGNNRPVDLSLRFRPRTGQIVHLGLLPALYAGLQKERLRTKDGTDVGIIRFNLWMLPVVSAFNQAIEEFRNTDGIVIDLRGNVGGMVGMLMGVAGHFLTERLSLGTLTTRDDQLQLFANPRLVNEAAQPVKPFAGPLAILVDNVSISASEVFAGGMQAIGRARVFGQTTAGQALPALFDKLPNGDVLLHAFGDYVTPNGVRLEGRGVKPDETVKVNRKDLLAGRDAPVEAALRWISKCKQQASKMGG